MISHVLKENPFYIKKIDLSYNTLNFQNSKADREYSFQFVRDMKSFFELTDLLNHLDISGMNFNDQSLIMLCESLSCCPNLMAIHLNDNNLMEQRNEELLKEILSIFDLGDHHIENVCRAKKETRDLNNDKQIKEMLVHDLDQHAQQKLLESKKTDMLGAFKQAL
jgi:Ran GTPase-activating protein (RanGAP) involved in mRNA processing and transport